jgi:hypothetical protein
LTKGWGEAKGESEKQGNTALHSRADLSDALDLPPKVRATRPADKKLIG